MPFLNRSTHSGIDKGVGVVARAEEGGREDVPEEGAEEGSDLGREGGREGGDTNEL